MTGRDLEGAVAVIGMSGRFPEARDVRTFWNNLVAGERGIRPLTEAEVAAVDPAVRANPGHVRVTAAVPDLEMWDAAFFGHTRRDAELTDPQHRLFLECAWEALEDAGYDPRNCPGVVGVLGGSGFPTYLVNNLSGHAELMAEVGSLRLAVGNERDTLTTKVSHQLDLRGPSSAVQSACSTSLLAVHLACQSLLSYESDVMLAGGAAISVPQAAGYIAETGDVAAARGEREHLALAPDGVCRSLDADGRGMVPGNGVGVVALKRAADAVRDGDHIYAMVIGSATNNDGGSRASYAAPGVRGQAEAMAEGLATAGTPADSISYVEVHGSGTLLGDSVELDAVGRAFTPRGGDVGPCVLGSVKANVGHLDRASGVTGLIKTALMLHHRTIPPQIDFETPNPSLDLSPAGFRIATAREEWSRRGGPLRGAVNSFGLGGTNAFVVLEEAPEVRREEGPDGPQLLVLSARTEDALDAATARLGAHLRDEPRRPLADVAFTLQTGRAAFTVRRVLVCSDHEDAVSALSEPGWPRSRSGAQASHGAPVTLLIPGREAVDPNAVAAGEHLPGFRAALAEVATAVGAEGADLGDHPAFAAAVDYSLGRTVLTCGISVDSIVGIGTGARVAACLRGELPLAALAGAPVGPTCLAAEPDRIVVAIGDSALPDGPPPRRVAAFQPGWSESPRTHLLDVIGRLWLHGAHVDWPALHAGHRRRVSLPSYPFERERFWIDPVPRTPRPRPLSAPDGGSLPAQTGASACTE